MNISIFGMGYVGVVSGACLLRDGHRITGVDPVESKVADLNNGLTPIQEPEVANMLTAGHKAGRLKASINPIDGVDGADMIFICVGTPSEFDGGINLSHVQACIGEIGESLRKTESRPLIVLRSTSLPGTTENMVIPTLEEKSGLVVGKDIHVVFHPEFLREGTAVEDFDEPPKIVVGEAHPGGGDVLMSVYGDKYDAPRYRLSLPEAEMVKYCDNLFHAVKVTFANEIGIIGRSVGVDTRKVSEVFCADTKLNINPYYLRPGFAYGGSCLPKDLNAIARFAALKALDTPMLRGVLQSNSAQINNFVIRILAKRPKSVGMVGLAFKPNTDDMRESPYVKVAKLLIGEGIELRVYDPCVQLDRLIGSNRTLVQRALGHLEDVLVRSLNELNTVDLILVNHATIDASQIQQWLDAGVQVIDLASIPGVDCNSDGYEGIAW